MIKKIIYTILAICLSSSLLVGCNNYTKLTFKEDIDYIEIRIGEKYKRISDLNTINNLISLIEKSNLREIKENRSIPYSKIDILIYFGEETDYKKITIIRDTLFYNGSYYKSKSNLGEQIEKIYLGINYPELIDKEEANKIKIKIINRKNLSLQKALEGHWIDSEGNGLHFENGRLFQGENEFRYRINSIDKNENSIHISVFGLKGFLVKGKKLFDLSINLDNTRNNLKLKKDMIGGYTYKYNMIYVDEQNNKIGTFESNFFIN